MQKGGYNLDIGGRHPAGPVVAEDMGCVGNIEPRIAMQNMFDCHPQARFVIDGGAIAVMIHV